LQVLLHGPGADIDRVGHGQPGHRERGTTSDGQPGIGVDASVALQAGKTVTWVVLPDDSSGVASGSPSLHIFAVTIQ
jgi:hypothetical protein